MDGIGDCSCQSAKPLAAEFVKIFPGPHGYNTATGEDGVMMSMDLYWITQYVYVWTEGGIEYTYFHGDYEGDTYGMTVPPEVDYDNCTFIAEYRRPHGKRWWDSTGGVWVYTECEIAGSWSGGIWTPDSPPAGGYNTIFITQAGLETPFWCGYSAVERFPEACTSYPSITPGHYLKQTVTETHRRFAGWGESTPELYEWGSTRVRTWNRWTGEMVETNETWGTEGPPGFQWEPSNWQIADWETTTKEEDHLVLTRRFDLIGSSSPVYYDELDYEEILEQPYSLADYIADCDALYDGLTISQMIERYNDSGKVRFQVAYDSSGDIVVTEEDETKECCNRECTLSGGVDPFSMGSNPYFYWPHTLSNLDPYPVYAERHLRGDNLSVTVDASHDNFGFRGTKVAAAIHLTQDQDGYIAPTVWDYEVINVKASICAPISDPGQDGDGYDVQCKMGPAVAGHTTTTADIAITQDASLETITGTDSAAATSQWLGIECDEDNEVVILHPKLT